MSFTAELIIPEEGQDDLGQLAKATYTFLEYRLELAYRGPDEAGSLGALEVLSEDLKYLPKGEAHQHVPFPHSARDWRSTVIKGRRTSPYISTEPTINGAEIRLHQDAGRGGKPVSYRASTLPRTVLSSATASESPTVSLARKEMRSWKVLQLEPTTLRRPDPFASPTHLSADGSHLPATLYRLSRNSSEKQVDAIRREARQEQVYATIANKLSELIDDVRGIWVERDDKRELLVVQARMMDGTVHPAMSLSDGTLRFLALSVLSIDPEVKGVVCLEEPENGIHPARITSMIDLLRSISVDANHPNGPDNPLRQVIINTHSPSVVAQILDQDLLFAEIRESQDDLGNLVKSPSCGCVSKTWRSRMPGAREASRQSIHRYLALAPGDEQPYPVNGGSSPHRLADRRDLQLNLFLQ